MKRRCRYDRVQQGNPLPSLRSACSAVLMIMAAGSSETSVYISRLLGATSQRTWESKFYTLRCHGTLGWKRALSVITFVSWTVWRTCIRTPIKDISEGEKSLYVWETFSVFLRTYRMIQWEPAFFPRVKRPERDVNHWPPSNVEVKREWSYTSIPPICLYGVDKENFTFLRFYHRRRYTRKDDAVLCLEIFDTFWSL
jgi:hypothetical protein